MIDVVAILDDGSVEQYRVVVPPNPEALAARQAEREALRPSVGEQSEPRNAFIDDIRAVMDRHGVTLRGGNYDDWPHFTGSFGEVDLGEWHETWE